MVQIIPAIIAKNIEELEEKIKIIEPYTDWVQIDVSDGIFTPNINWNNPEDLKKIKSNVALEIHLMISNPEDFMDEWIDSGAKRIIVHVSNKSDFEGVKIISEKVKSRGLQFGIGLSPEVSVVDVQNIIPLADVVLLLAVDPGFSGQQFQPVVLEKIKDLRKLFPDVKIEIDGGINEETADQCIKAGADILVSASYIFDSENIEKAIATLKNTLTNYE